MSGVRSMRLCRMWIGETGEALVATRFRRPGRKRSGLEFEAKRDSLKGRKRTRRRSTFNDWLIDNFGTPSYDQRRGRDNPWVQSTVGWRL